MTIKFGNAIMKQHYEAFTDATDLGWTTVRAANPAEPDYTYIARIRTWINENCTGRTRQWGSSFAFESESDAVLFALIWG